MYVLTSRVGSRKRTVGPGEIIETELLRTHDASTYFAYPQRDDQAELACVAWLDTKTVYPRMVTHLNTNPAQRRVTSLICSTNDVTTKLKRGH